MARAIRHVPARERGDTTAIDTVILTSDQRRTAKGDVVGIRGMRITIDLPNTPRMQTDDVLVLEDGRLIEVVAAVEPLYEVRAADLAALARLAWHLGDRHTAVEVLSNRLRVRREDAVERLLAELGAGAIAIEAPFEPEGGAYAIRPDHEAHDHAHHHGHDHRHWSK